MKLLLVKHSTSNHNPFQPSHEWALTDEGIARCQPLANHIAPFKPPRLFASDMPRAEHTAQLVAQSLGNLPVTVDSRLREHSRRSNAPYGTVEEFRNRIQRMFNEPDTLIFGDETASAAQQRFSGGVQAVIQQAQPDENIVIVAHGTVNALFTAQYNDINLYDFWSNLGLPSIIVLDIPTFRLDTVIVDAGVPPNMEN